MKPATLGAILWPEAIVGLALLVLLGASLGAAYLPLGTARLFVNYGIAATQTILIVTGYVHLGRKRPLIRLAALAGLFWLATMFLLTFSDYTTR